MIWLFDFLPFDFYPFWLWLLTFCFWLFSCLTFCSLTFNLFDFFCGFDFSSDSLLFWLLDILTFYHLTFCLLTFCHGIWMTWGYLTFDRPKVKWWHVGIQNAFVHRLLSSGNRLVLTPTSCINLGKRYSAPEFLREVLFFCILATEVNRWHLLLMCWTVHVLWSLKHFMYLLTCVDAFLGISWGTTYFLTIKRVYWPEVKWWPSVTQRFLVHNPDLWRSISFFLPVPLRQFLTILCGTPFSRIFCWIQALSVCSDHCMAMGCRIERWQWSWEKWTSPK